MRWSRPFLDARPLFQVVQHAKRQGCIFILRGPQVQMRTGGCLPNFLSSWLFATQAPYADENILSLGATGRSLSDSPVVTPEVCTISPRFDWRIDSVKASTCVSDDG